MSKSTILRALPLALAAGLLAAPVHALTPEQLLAAYSAQAKAAASPERGQKMFTTNFGKELGLSCSSCHGAVPVKNGKNELSGKSILPLAPAANPGRFTDQKRADNWFRDNCKDVVGRECSAGEKADILSWLLTLKP